MMDIKLEQLKVRDRAQAVGDGWGRISDAEVLAAANNRSKHCQNGQTNLSNESRVAAVVDSRHDTKRA